jgi:methylated-DNA-protein-cysteine methyltransferase related protein
MASKSLPQGRTSDNTDFFERVFEVVEQIPYGRVTTYGHIAEFLGTRQSARAVGWALNSAAGTPMPCHRVVNRFGALSGKRHFEGPHVMEERLRSEGITMLEDGCVDLERHLWIPGEGS